MNSALHNNFDSELNQSFFSSYQIVGPLEQLPRKSDIVVPSGAVLRIDHLAPDYDTNDEQVVIEQDFGIETDEDVKDEVARSEKFE